MFQLCQNKYENPCHFGILIFWRKSKRRIFQLFLSVWKWGTRRSFKHQRYAWFVEFAKTYWSL